MTEPISRPEEVHPPVARRPVASVVRPAIVYLTFFGSIGAYFPYVAVYYRSIGLTVESIGLLTMGAAARTLGHASWHQPRTRKT